MQEVHQKHVANMRSWLQGATFANSQWGLALEAFEFARSHHTGMRKDGVTPEYHHQLRIAQRALPILPHVTYPIELMATAFLHDIPEDKAVTHEQIKELFGPIVHKGTMAMTKKYLGENLSYEEYFSNIANCPIASIVKPLDRIDNITSMHDAGWDVQKMNDYAVDEVLEHFLPMIKRARVKFPTQFMAYRQVKTTLSELTQTFQIQLQPQMVA